MIGQSDDTLIFIYHDFILSYFIFLLFFSNKVFSYCPDWPGTHNPSDPVSKVHHNETWQKKIT